MYINRVHLAGNLTRDPDHKLVGQNSNCKFGLAVNRKYTGKDGTKRDEVVFIDCEAWGKLADLINQYCVKGKPIYVEGRLCQDQWRDSAGNKRSRIYITAESMQFVPTGDKEEVRKQSSDAYSDEPPFHDNDIPF